MAFPLTHLCVARQVLDKFPAPSPELFLLGSIAPDAVHYRDGFVGATMNDIGPAKKLTHLYPPGSEEKWGQITDINGWAESILAFLHANPNDDLAIGYVVHILTDMHNHQTIWNEYRANYSEEFAKGYASKYYTDLKSIDIRLYNEFFKSSATREMLESATPRDIPNLICKQELEAIKNNLINIQYKNAPTYADTSGCVYITYEKTLQFIQDAAEFCLKIL